MSSDSCVFSAPLSVRTAEVIVVDCERGAGDLRELLRQVYWKDGTLLAEHDWLHDDPTYANFFLRSAAERGEWQPVKLRDQVGAQADAVPVPAAADQPGIVFSGVDVQQDRISEFTDGHRAKAGTRLKITLTELGGWHVKASHPFGHAFTGHFRTDADVQRHIGAWLAELRAEAALGRNETQEEERARVAQEIHESGRLPDYLDAGWRNVTPVCEQTGRIGIGFDTAEGPVRLAISLEYASELASCLDAYIKAFAGSQSCGSGLMPSAPRSVPSDGEKT